MEDLNNHIDPTSGWVLESGLAINSWGEITGLGRLNGEPRAYKLSPSGDITFLPVPEGTTISLGFDINDRGDVSGVQKGPDDIIHPVYWDAELNDQMIVLDGTWEGGAVAINYDKKVAATLSFGVDETRGVLVNSDGTTTNIGVLGDPAAGCIVNSSVRDINNAGTVVGSSTITTVRVRGKKQTVTCGPVHAIRYTAAAGLEDLATLGGAASFATAINGLGDIVGTSEIDPAILVSDIFLFADLDGDGQPEGMVNVPQGIINPPPNGAEEGLIQPLRPEAINNSLEIAAVM